MPKPRWGGCAERCEAMTYKLVTAYTADGEQLKCLHATDVTPGYLESASTVQKSWCEKSPREVCAPQDPGWAGYGRDESNGGFVAAEMWGWAKMANPSYKGNWCWRWGLHALAFPAFTRPKEKDVRDKTRKNISMARWNLSGRPIERNIRSPRELADEPENFSPWSPWCIFRGGNERVSKLLDVRGPWNVQGFRMIRSEYEFAPKRRHPLWRRT